jgi:hypothetical protein
MGGESIGAMCSRGSLWCEQCLAGHYVQQQQQGLIRNIQNRLIEKKSG